MGTKRFDDVRDFHRHGVAIAVFCTRCRKYAEIDPASLILRPGMINQHPSALPWRCSRCGASGKDILSAYAARMQSHKAIP